MARDSADTAAIVAMALLAAGEVPNFLAGMLPSLMTIKRFAADPTDVAALRHGEITGSAVSMVIAVGASIAVRSAWPAVAAGGVLVYMLWQYEHAIRLAQDNPDAVPIDQQPNGGRRVA